MKIHYIFDTMCGWCWGFSPVYQRLHQEYADQFTFELYSGGLALGNRAVPIKEGYGYIKGALKTVEDTTGVKFGEGFRRLLEEGTYVYDSLPPARALAAIKAKAPKHTFAAAHRIQEALFVQGKDLNQWSTYQAIGQELFPAKVEEVKALYQSPASTTLAQQEFISCQQLGVSGYPTLVLEVQKKYYALSRGYAAYQTIAEQLNTVLKMQNSA